jgi:hypothetical protein
MPGVVPANVRLKRSKMMRGLSVKNVVLLWKPAGSNRTVLFESENKEGYIHGFTENYVKVKHLESWISEHFTRNQSDKIDDDAVSEWNLYGSSLGFKH